MIVGTTVLNEPNSFLATEKDYGDFIVEMEFKLDDVMNSGIQFRSESKEDYMKGRVHGYQYEIDPSARAWTAGIYDEARRDWLYPMDYNPSVKPSFKLHEWNKVRIECIGTSIRTFLNGQPAADLVDDMTPKGFIALQVHQINKAEEVGRKIYWRNIRIQTTNLQPAAVANIFTLNLLPNNLSVQEKQHGVSLLFDGKTTAGWRGVYKTTFPEKGWQVKDGTLTVLSSNGAESNNGGDIVTEKNTMLLFFSLSLN